MLLGNIRFHSLPQANKAPGICNRHVHAYMNKRIIKWICIKYVYSTINSAYTSLLCRDQTAPSLALTVCAFRVVCEQIYFEVN